MRDSYKFRRNAQPSDPDWEIELELLPDEYKAIGKVSAQWGFLEFHISRLCRVIANNIEEPLADGFDSDSFRARKRAWQDLVKKALPEGSPERKSMDQIIKKAGELQGERQLTIHSFFEWHEKDSTKLKGHSPKNPNDRPRSFTADTIDEIAIKIAKLNAELIMWPDNEPEFLQGIHTHRNSPSTTDGGE